MTWYLTLCADSTYSQSTPTQPLLDYLRTFPELVDTHEMSLRSTTGCPWCVVILAQANSCGSYAVHGNFVAAVNCVDFVCGDGHEEWHQALADRVATFLGWEFLQG